MERASEQPDLARQIELLRDEQRAVGDVLRAVARGEGLDSVLHALVESAARLCDAQYGEVHLLEGDLLTLAVGHGGPDELYAYERAHPHPATGDRGSMNGRVVLARDVVHIPDILVDPEYSWPGAESAGVRAMLGAPLIVEDQLLGVFNLVRTEAVPYRQEQIDLLRTFADQAAIAVWNARLLEAIERQRSELARFVAPAVAQLLSSPDGEKQLAGHRGYISVLFCDLRGFTAFTQTAEPEELFEVLRDYHAALGDLIGAHLGTLEHFAGDGVMVFFNDPLPVADHELEAIRFALAMVNRVEILAEGWRKRGYRLGLGVGIAAGYATLGRIGYEGRYDYAAVGTVSNLASRLSDRAEAGQVLISERLFAAVDGRVEAEPVGDLDLKGFREPVGAYKVVGLRP
ncbi:MAG: adenylate/guanylate cyclase domain-containing protein [Chloroflexota bacterium]